MMRVLGTIRGLLGAPATSPSTQRFRDTRLRVPLGLHLKTNRLLPIGRPYAQTASHLMPATHDLDISNGVENAAVIQDEVGPGALMLRPYQETAISACLSALAAGHTRIGVSSPTGSGKTTMFMSLIPRVSASHGRARTLILVGSVELANQAEAAAKKLLGDGWKVEVEQSKRLASGFADV